MSEPICRCWYDHEQYKITTDCPTHSNNSAVAYLRAEVEELRKDRERYQLIKTAAVVATIGEYCDTFWIIDGLDVADTSITDIADDDYAAIFEHQVDAAIEAANGGE